MQIAHLAIEVYF